MIRNITNRVYRFSTNQKYFLDTNYKSTPLNDLDVTVIAHDTPGNLSRLSNIFASYGVNLTYVRTHFENLKKGDRVKYRLEISLNAGHNYIYEKAKSDLEVHGITLEEADPIQVPWFPRTHKDVDLIGQILLEVNESKEHSQFQDEAYRERRDFIAKVAKEYRMGQPIPEVAYSKEETELWVNIYKKLSNLHKESMCDRFLSNMEELSKEVKISERIPQLN